MTNDWFSKLQEILSPNFEVLKVSDDAVFLENHLINWDDYSLDCRFLTKHEILEIGRILAEVYKDLQPSALHMVNRQTNQSLNRDSKSSTLFVRAVLALDASVLHKLLLLTSGEQLLSNDNLDIVKTLAMNKNDACAVFRDPSSLAKVFNNLKKLYIFPGVTVGSGVLEDIPVEISSDRNAVELVSKLMVFLSNDSTELTLREHLDLELSEGLREKDSLKTAIALKDVLKIVFSRYEKLAETMTASQLVSLSCILDNATSEGVFPESILFNRSKVMEVGLIPIGTYRKDSILRYLSKDEQDSITSKNFSDTINDLLNSRDSRARTPPIILAALAEVLAVKGEKRALEVARSLVHVKLSKDRSLRMYEATVGVIAEALKPENDDLPFAWTAQMSEHSWVLSSHIRAKKDYAKLL